MYLQSFENIYLMYLKWVFSTKSPGEGEVHASENVLVAPRDGKFQTQI